MTSHVCLQGSKPALGCKQSPLGSAEAAVHKPPQTGPGQVGNALHSTINCTEFDGQRVLADTVSPNSQVDNAADTEMDHGDAEHLQAVSLAGADVQKVKTCFIMHLLAVPLLLPSV